MISPERPIDTYAKRPHRLLLLLVLSISAFIQFTVVSRTVVDGPLRADAGQYFSYAYNLSHHGVFSMSPTWQEGAKNLPLRPDSLRAPGYPVFLALVGRPEANETYLRRVTTAQAVLGVLSVLLVYLIASRFLAPGWALTAALLTALSPHLAMMSTYLLTESLFFFLLMGSLLMLLVAVQSNRRWPWIATGVLWGLSTLVKPTAQFFPVVLFFVVLVVPSLRSVRLSAALAFACFVAVLAPWVIRNQSAAVERPASLMVLTLAHGSYPDFMYQGRRETFGFPYRFDPQIDVISRDLPSVLGHIAGRFRAEPLTYLRWYAIGKPGYFLAWGNVQGWDILVYPVLHTPYFEDPLFGLVRTLSYFLHWPLMLLGLAGAAILALRARWLVLSPAQNTAATVVALLVVYAIAFHMIVAPFPRYGVPFRPLIFALAMLTLRALWLGLSSRWRLASHGK